METQRLQSHERLFPLCPVGKSWGGGTLGHEKSERRDRSTLCPERGVITHSSIQRVVSLEVWVSSVEEMVHSGKCLLQKSEGLSSDPQNLHTTLGTKSRSWNSGAEQTEKQIPRVC